MNVKDRLSQFISISHKKAKRTDYLGGTHFTIICAATVHTIVFLDFSTKISCWIREGQGPTPALELSDSGEHLRCWTPPLPIFYLYDFLCISLCFPRDRSGKRITKGPKRSMERSPCCFLGKANQENHKKEKKELYPQPNPHYERSKEFPRKAD